jgi:phosphatidylglycerol:prolipoprotein diacylglycerol transferase
MLKIIKLFDNVSIGSYNICLGLGMIAAFLFLDSQMKKEKISQKTESQFYISLICAFIIGFIGADIFEFLFHHDKPFTIHNLLQSGITFYGGFVTGILVFLLISYFLKLNILFFINFSIPSLVVAHAFGRIGCFLGGCCFGCPTNSIFGVVFPKNSLPYDFYKGALPIHPTQLYESIFLFLLFFILIKYISFNYRTIVYLIFYGIFRFLLEYLRGDDRGSILNSSLSPSQIISIILFISGILLFFIAKNNQQKKNLF